MDTKKAGSHLTMYTVIREKSTSTEMRNSLKAFSYLFNNLTSCLAFSGAGALPWKKSTSSRIYWVAELQFWRKRKSASLPSSKLTCCPHRGARLYQSGLADAFCHLYTYSCCGSRLVKRHLCH